MTNFRGLASFASKQRERTQNGALRLPLPNRRPDRPPGFGSKQHSSIPTYKPLKITEFPHIRLRITVYPSWCEERPACEEFGDEIRVAVMHAGIVDRENVWVVERGERFGFGLEPPQTICV